MWYLTLQIFYLFFKVFIAAVILDISSVVGAWRSSRDSDRRVHACKNVAGIGNMKKSLYRVICAVLTFIAS